MAWKDCMKLTLAEPNKKWKYYVFDKFLHKLCFIGVKKKIDKERDTVCFHGNANDLFKNVSSQLEKCFIDIKLIKDIIFSFFVGFSKCQLHAVFSCHVELNLLKYHLYYETMHIKCVFLHISTIPVINPYNRPSV
jgi:hypothetical protein